MAGKAYQVQINVVGDASSASKTMDQLGAKAESTANKSSGAFKAMGGIIKSAAGSAFGPMQEGLAAVTAGIDHVKEHGKGVASMMTGIGVGVAGLGILGQQIGSKDREANNQLKASIESLGKSYEDFAPQIEKAIKAEEKHGHTANQTQNALQTLTDATKDPAKALELLSTASDLAAKKHIDLNAAATMLGKTYNGATKLLKEFNLEAGPKHAAAVKAALSAQLQSNAADAAEAKAKENLVQLHERLAAKKKLSVSDNQALVKANEAVAAAVDKAEQAQGKLAAANDTVTKSTTSSEDALKQISERLHGQADAAANSFAGRLRAVKAEIEDGAAKLGQKYGPALTVIGTGMTSVTGILSLFKKGQEAAVVATDVMTGSTEALTVAETEEAVAEGLALGPILLIIAAVALLAFGIYELATHWKQVWKWIQEAVGTAFDWVKSHWPLLLAILTGPFGLALLFVKSHWHEITDDVGSAISWVKSHWPLLLAVLTGPFGLAVLYISHHVDDIVGFITGFPGRIAGVASHMWDGIGNAFKGMINWIIRMWNGLGFTVPSVDVFGMHLGGGRIQVPQVPTLDAGGIATGPMLAHLAMNRQPEVVAPLSSLPAMLASISGGSGGSATAAGAGGGHGHDILLDGKLVGRAVAPSVRSQFVNGSGRGAVRGNLTGVGR